MRGPKYKPGDRVVYRKLKHGTRPGPRARQVTPSSGGDDYSYFVDKFWLVVDSLGDQVILQTRRGKRRILAAANRNLRRASWWDLLMHRSRFPSGPVGHSS